MVDLDDTDRAILYFLQTGARDVTNTEIGEKIGVSTATVGERIKRMRDSGIIQNSCIDINYEKAGLPHHVLLMCSVPASDRERIAEQAIQKHGVVNVREFRTGSLHIEIVGQSNDEISETIKTLEELGATVNQSEEIKQDHRRPFNGLGHPTI